ncbi:hypothetical protein G7Z17_g3350 [Cylindrodendrum hubeiense]|uniref:Chromo domain-containing protein n=1 Tax=Cylindrodendrum hubeiense TaxID=595255 RepID=A0A9P5HI65_9HYPO|nr:hypothetical protein G7Z17_g3350 [Cylindrodendrum hubeiense]
MPPALSDDDSSDQSEFTAPVRPTRKAASAPSIDPVSDINDDEVEAPNGDSADEGDEDMGSDEEGLDEDVFIVETIKDHNIDEDGSLKFQVKWEGYESKKDLTWEPEANLKESAEEILDIYFDSIGGRDKIFEESTKAAKTKKRRRTTNGGTPSTTTKRSRHNGVHPAETTPPATAKKWSPPAGSWEDEIETIDACEDEGSGKLIVYLIWKNGQKTKHNTDIIYKKCPQKMLHFYERHVKIIRDEKKALAEEAEM